MKSPNKANALFTAGTILLTTIVAGASQQAASAPQAGTPATIPSPVVAAAEKIATDPQVIALLEEQSTDAAAKARWNQFLELVRIPSPPRYEHLKAAEIHRRLVNGLPSPCPMRDDESAGRLLSRLSGLRWRVPDAPHGFQTARRSRCRSGGERQQQRERSCEVEQPPLHEPRCKPAERS